MYEAPAARRKGGRLVTGLEAILDQIQQEAASQAEELLSAAILTTLD